MFSRQPEQRILSMAAMIADDPDECSHSFNGSCDYETMLENLKVSQLGCATKMMVRTTPLFNYKYRNCEAGSPPTNSELDEAKIRVQTGFSFIGDTNRWDLSICLFNVMFNQQCISVQFGNGHPTSGNTLSAYDTTLLNGWSDPYDNELYDLAMAIFDANLKKYNVSDASCAPCWSEAGLL